MELFRQIFKIKKYALTVAGINGVVTKEPDLSLYDSGLDYIIYITEQLHHADD